MIESKKIRAAAEIQLIQQIIVHQTTKSLKQVLLYAILIIRAVLELSRFTLVTYNFIYLLLHHCKC